MDLTASEFTPVGSVGTPSWVGTITAPSTTTVAERRTGSDEPCPFGLLFLTPVNSYGRLIQRDGERPPGELLETLYDKLAMDGVPEWLTGGKVGDSITPTRWIVAYPLYGLAVISLAMRIYARLHVARQLSLDDYLILAATLLGAVLLGINSTGISLIHSLNKSVATPGLESFVDVVNLREELGLPLKLAFISGLLYPTQMALIKLSILAFYHRLMSTQRSRWGLYVVAAFILILTVVLTLLLLFGCWPISHNWLVLGVPRNCPVHPFRLQVANSATNLISDILIMVLPIPMVWRLQLNAKKKVGLMFIFLLGIIGTVATLVRLIQVTPAARRSIMGPISSLNAAAGITWWSLIELYLASICANLPAVAGFWRLIRRQRKATYRSTGASGPQAGLHYHLGSMDQRKKKMVTTVTGDAGTASQEEILAPKQEILRSTHVEVDIEQAHEEAHAR